MSDVEHEAIDVTVRVYDAEDITYGRIEEVRAAREALLGTDQDIGPPPLDLLKHLLSLVSPDAEKVDLEEMSPTAATQLVATVERHFTMRSTGLWTELTAILSGGADGSEDLWQTLFNHRKMEIRTPKAVKTQGGSAVGPT